MTTTILLILHLFIALMLIGAVLLQRSEGGALGIGGGPGSLMSGRSAANALSKATTVIAAAFFLTSIGLTVLARQGGDGGSVLDTLAPEEGGAPARPETLDEGLQSLIDGAEETAAPADPDAPVTVEPGTAPAATDDDPPAEAVDEASEKGDDGAAPADPDDDGRSGDGGGD